VWKGGRVACMFKIISQEVKLECPNYSNLNLKAYENDTSYKKIGF
jgi:hypothetical protein